MPGATWYSRAEIFRLIPALPIEMTVLREGKLMQLRAPMPDLADIRESYKKKR